MSSKDSHTRRASRRSFLARAAGVMTAAGASLGIGVPAALAEAKAEPGRAAPDTRETEAFWGLHQGGIVTLAQQHSYFAAFDLTTGKREEVIALLRSWTSAAARMAAGETAQPLEEGLNPVGSDSTAKTRGYEDEAKRDPRTMAADSGEALGLAPARLTITFGIGAGLFTKDGKDRYGLASRRPAALVDLPKFTGDQLVATQTEGDLSIQACADDPQVAFHAVRQLARLAQNVAQVRWAQTGFIPGFKPGETPRNLMGFRDGTNNPSVSDAKAMDKFVWVGSEGPDWMRGGSYVVVRRIRIALEHWDRMKVAFQEQTVGREKYSGAPLGKKKEFDPLDLETADKDGNPIIAETAHVRLATAASNDGAQILRRPYSYNDGVNFIAERWPPWRQGMEYDAGLFFVAYQRDPRTGFIKIYEPMSKLDMMNQFVTHVGGGLFACPRGPAKGEFIGQRLFETA